MVYDVVIVGAGIQGLMIARDISLLNKNISLVVVDMNSPCFGASGRSAGYDIPGGGTPKVRQMSQYSQTYYQQFLNDNSGYYPVNTKVHSISNAPIAYFNAGMCSETSSSSHEDGIQAEGYNVWECASCYYGDLFTVTKKIISKLDKIVNIIEGQFVDSIDEYRGYIQIRFHSGITIKTNNCILAPGPWANSQPFKEYTEKFGIKVKKVVAFHVPSEIKNDNSAHYFYDDQAFLLPLQHQQYWLFSYTCQTWGVLPDDRIAISAKDISDAKSILQRYSTQLSEQLISGRAFCDAYSPEREPIVDYANSSETIIFSGASNGSGFRLAPAISKQTVELLNV